MSTVMLQDGRNVKLGRKRPAARPQCLRLGVYLNASKRKAPPPPSTNWRAKAATSLARMYLNDEYGDCVIASKYHAVGVWSSNDGPAPILGDDAEVLASYHKICGNGDPGCVISEVLDYWQSRGLPFKGAVHKIDGYVSVDWTNKLEVQTAIALFGGLTLGINLPGDWTCTNCTWTETNSRIVGGHDVRAVDYDSNGVQVSTWAGIVTIAWPAFLSTRWIEECYCELSPDWYNENQLAPNGIDVATLRADLAKIGGGTIPPLPDPEPPGPPDPVPPFPPDPTPPLPPVPPTPPPAPRVITIHIPSQPVYGGFFNHQIGTVPAFDVTFTIDTLSAFTIPPWLIPVLRALCASAPALPPPYNLFLGLICSMLPKGTKNPCGCKEALPAA